MSKPLPNVHYGKIGKPSKTKPNPMDDRDDDEELEKTPSSIKKMLGFDPKEFSKKPIKPVKTR